MPRSKPLCHPEKEYGAKGLCRNCYNKHLRATNPKYKANCAKASKDARNKPAGKRAFTSAILKLRYGITLEEREAMFLRQAGLCAICDQSKRLVVDHCHRTGKVRGLVCNRCNTLIAQVENNAGIVERARVYIGDTK